MLFDPEKDHQPVSKDVQVSKTGKLVKKRKREFKGNLKLFERWVKFKQYVLLRAKRKKDNANTSPEKKSLLSIFFW